MTGIDKKRFAGIIAPCFEVPRNGQKATLFLYRRFTFRCRAARQQQSREKLMSNKIKIENTASIINRMAVSLANVAEAEALTIDGRDSLNALLNQAREAGVRFMLQSRDGKGVADKCPNRKALKTALLARFTETRARDLTGFLVLYYEAGAPVGSLRNYDAVYECVGKTALAKLNISPSKADNTANKKAGIVLPDTKAAKAAKRLIEQQGIEVAFATFSEHPEFGMFTAWLALPPKKRGDDFVAWVKTQKDQKTIEKAKADWIEQGKALGFNLK